MPWWATCLLNRLQPHQPYQIAPAAPDRPPGRRTAAITAWQHAIRTQAQLSSGFLLYFILLVLNAPPTQLGCSLLIPRGIYIWAKKKKKRKLDKGPFRMFQILSRFSTAKTKFLEKLKIMNVCKISVEAKSYFWHCSNFSLVFKIVGFSRTFWTVFPGLLRNDQTTLQYNRKLSHQQTLHNSTEFLN